MGGVQHPVLRFAAHPLPRSYARMGSEPLSADTAGSLPPPTTAEEKFKEQPLRAQGRSEHCTLPPRFYVVPRRICLALRHPISLH